MKQNNYLAIWSWIVKNVKIKETQPKKFTCTYPDKKFNKIHSMTIYANNKTEARATMFNKYIKHRKNMLKIENYYGEK